jgi:hypothetical protein
MNKFVTVIFIVVTTLLIGGCAVTQGDWKKASSAVIETQHLIVSDATGNLSNDQLKRSADQAQAMLERILAFWSADSRVDQWGKIRVIFDVPRGTFYSSVLYLGEQDGRRIRIVLVFKAEGSPQMMVQKLTHAVFLQKDKLICNIMGIITEEQFGNPLSFPACGFSSDDWVLALLEAKSYIPLNKLGPDHESWGMKDFGGRRLMIVDSAKQHKAYAETGSFGNYLFKTYGIEKTKRFDRLSREKDRPWQDVFGISLQELEANWLNNLRANGITREGNVVTLLKLFKENPYATCSEAQKLAPEKQ